MQPERAVLRPDPGLRSYERALRRHGFDVVAGTDEAGRGASAGPLVVAAVSLPDGDRGRVPGLADSKLLSAAQREAVYAQVVRRALDWQVVVVPSTEIDRLGIHVVNIQAMRRALAALRPAPSFVLSDGFAVPGLPVPALGVPKGDRVAACVAAASVVAKVTRDRMMCELALRHPGYGFDRHKGYNAPDHLAALDELGPCPEHRRSWITVRIRQPGAFGGPPSSPAPPRVVQTVPMDCEQVEDR